MARLTLFDDGSVEGEMFRIKNDATYIGRQDCDINIHHDEMISKRHLAIDREIKNGVARWIIKDLKSATGLWVRVRRIELNDGAEFLVGGQRIRFQESMPIDASTREAMLDRIENGSYSGTASIASHAYSTLCREDYAPARAVPSNPLVATGKPATRESSLTLIDGEYWIGRGPECAMRIQDDIFLASKHACIASSVDRRWIARTEGAPNGMWVRMDQIIVNRSCTFQIGEQRCRFVCAWTRDEI